VTYSLETQSAASILPLKGVCKMGNVRTFKAKTLVPGKATGPALITRERLSFQGFTDPNRGIFIAPQTELQGKSFKGAVLIFTSGKGSSAGASTLDLACRLGNSPAAIINLQIDSFIAAGCVLEDIPLVQVEDPSIFDQVKNGDIIMVDADKGEIKCDVTSY